MTHTRFAKSLLKPVLAGSLMLPSLVYGAPELKVTGAELLSAPAKYDGLQVKVTTLRVDALSYKEARGKTYTFMTLAAKFPPTSKKAPARGIKNRTVQFIILGRQNIAKGNRVDVAGTFHTSFTNSEGKTIPNVVIGRAAWKRPPAPGRQTVRP